MCPLNPIQVLHQTESKSFFDKDDLDAKLYTFFFRSPPLPPPAPAPARTRARTAPLAVGPRPGPVWSRGAWRSTRLAWSRAVR